MRFLALALIAALALWAGGCAAPSVRLTPRYQELGIEGDLAVSSSGVSGRTSAESLGLDEEERGFSPRADLLWGGARLSASYAEGAFDGEGTTEAQLDLGGTVISVGTDVSSALDLAYASSALTWDLVPTDLVELGIGFGAGAADLEARFESLAAPGTVIETEERAAFPMLAVRAGVEVGPVLVEGLLSGTDIEIDEVDAALYDLDLAAHLRLFRASRVRGYLTVGYRLLRADVQYEDEESDVEVDVDVDGLYVGATLTL